MLHRDYKPVGFAQLYRKFDIETWPVAYEVSFTPEQAASISHESDRETWRIYLYQDDSAPWTNLQNEAAYLNRLAIFWRIEDEARLHKPIDWQGYTG